MSKPDYRLPLPAVIDPEGRRCVTIYIPDDLGHITAFWGFLQKIAWSNRWARDPDHKAAAVARVWQEVWNDARARFDLGQCGRCESGEVCMQLRQNGCKLEGSVDCETWFTLYDPTDCIKNIGGGQPPGEQPGDGACTEYDAQLQANNRWLLPVQVFAGDNIIVSNASGAWNDGGAVIWNCPDGSQFSLGACIQSGHSEVGDPLNTARHMTLLGYIEGTGYFDALAGTHVVTGAGPSFVYFQGNDSNIANNLGSVSFHVQVCRPAAAFDWSITIDLETSNVVAQHSWSYQANQGATPNWVLGRGYGGVNIYRLWADNIHLHSTGTTTLTGWRVKGSSIDPDEPNGITYLFKGGDPGPQHIGSGIWQNQFILDPPITVGLDLDLSSGAGIHFVGAQNNESRLAKIVLFGNGDPPTMTG